GLVDRHPRQRLGIVVDVLADVADDRVDLLLRERLERGLSNPGPGNQLLNLCVDRRGAFRHAHWVSLVDGSEQASIPAPHAMPERASDGGTHHPKRGAPRLAGHAPHAFLEPGATPDGPPQPRACDPEPDIVALQKRRGPERGDVAMYPTASRSGLRLALAALALCSAGGVSAGPSEPGICNVGPRPAPLDFTLPSLDGQEVTLSDYAGHVILIDFWATWCAPCRDEIPGLVELYEKHKDAGFVVLGV